MTSSPHDVAAPAAPPAAVPGTPPAAEGRDDNRPRPASSGADVPAAAPGAARRPRRRVLIAIVAILVVGAAWLLLHRRSPPTGLEVAGTVEATEAALGFAAAGRIATIAVHEGEVARAGAVLAVLDTSELVARIRQAGDQARLAAAQLADLERGARPQDLEDRRQAARVAQRMLDDATLDLARLRRLSEGVVSRQTLDKAQIARDVAASRLAQARAALSLTQVGARPDQVAAARAAAEAAQAQVGVLEATRPNYLIRAPWTGLVTARAREPGEVVAGGAPVVTLLDADDRWVRIYIPEDRVGAVRLGQAATITSDAYPGRAFGGVVRWIASDAEFTPRNVQTKDARVRLVYAAKVQVTRDPAFVLKPGTPADVELALAPAAGR